MWWIYKNKSVQFDCEIEFTKGGGLQGWGFLLNIDGDDITQSIL